MSKFLQYEKSTKLNALSDIANGKINDNLNVKFDKLNFFNDFFNINSCGTEGLNNWGRILNRSRTIKLNKTDKSFGFESDGVPYDPLHYPQPLNNGENEVGGIFYTKTSISDIVYEELNNEAYRALLKFTYLCSISNGSVQQINSIMQSYFSNFPIQNEDGTITYINRGECYCYENTQEVMNIIYVFNFQLYNYEYTLFSNTFLENVLPTPSCVSATIIQNY